MRVIAAVTSVRSMIALDLHLPRRTTNTQTTATASSILLLLHQAECIPLSRLNFNHKFIKTSANKSSDERKGTHEFFQVCFWTKLLNYCSRLASTNTSTYMKIQLQEVVEYLLI